uniref:Putative secreted peptide n=1 Tax=Anopheles braziliensis TaxID=58242 RepID=A0A2M3ZN12_9DIPT
MQLLGILPVLLSVCCVVLPRVLLLRGCATLASFLTVSGVWVYFTETELRSHRCHHNSSTRRIRGGASGWLGVSDTDGIGVEGVAALGRPLEAGRGVRASCGGGARRPLEVGRGFGASLGGGAEAGRGVLEGGVRLRDVPWRRGPSFLQGPAGLVLPSGSGCRLVLPSGPG